MTKLHLPRHVSWLAVLWTLFYLINFQAEGTNHGNLGCQVPYMDPLDNSVKKFYKYIQPLKCSDKPPLVISNLTHLIINKKYLHLYGVSSSSLRCSYEPFRRKDSWSNKFSSSINYQKSGWGSFYKHAKINYEFVRVICFNNSVKFYEDFHSFVQVCKKGYNHGERELSVMIVGLHAVSRLNFHRTMPLTSNYLLNKLNAIEFVRFNKIGEKTYSNLMALLTGQSVTQLENTCIKNLTLDKCEFIWDKFKESKYVTAFCEDCITNELFLSDKRGFVVQPTSHYWSTFSFEAEKNTGHNKGFCIGPMLTYKMMLKYSIKFITSYRKIHQKFFGFFWETCLTHNSLNNPSAADVDFMNYFKVLRSSNILEKTVLLFISDHGMQSGPIVSTHQGQMEDRLPMLFMVLPKWFHDECDDTVEILKENAEKLTTPFDIYKTLIDISQNDFYNKCTTNTAGISLFRPIPKNRTCKTANIPTKYCACQNAFPMSTSEKIVHDIVKTIINFINEKLRKFRKCSILSLSKIIDASFSKSFRFLNRNQSTLFFTITLQIKPGNAILEAHVKSTDSSGDTQFQINGPIIKKNKNERENNCTTNGNIRQYCYC